MPAFHRRSPVRIQERKALAVGIALSSRSMPGRREHRSSGGCTEGRNVIIGSVETLMRWHGSESRERINETSNGNDRLAPLPCSYLFPLPSGIITSVKHLHHDHLPQHRTIPGCSSYHPSPYDTDHSPNSYSASCPRSLARLQSPPSQRYYPCDRHHSRPPQTPCAHSPSPRHRPHSQDCHGGSGCRRWRTPARQRRRWRRGRPVRRGGRRLARRKRRYGVGRSRCGCAGNCRRWGWLCSRRL
jgi:hypothetical protein